jgi:hypothetical protein
MTYEKALKAAKRVGASKAEGIPLLAMTVATLALVHAINPRLAYAGAIKRSLTAAQVRKLDPMSLGDLMFA